MATSTRELRDPDRMKKEKARKLATTTSLSVREIAKETGVPKSTVFRYRTMKPRTVPMLGRRPLYFPPGAGVPLRHVILTHSDKGRFVTPESLVPEGYSLRAALQKEGFVPGKGSPSNRGMREAARRQLAKSDHTGDDVASRHAIVVDPGHCGVRYFTLKNWYGTTAKEGMDWVKGSPKCCTIAGDELVGETPQGGKGKKRQVLLRKGAKTPYVPSVNPAGLGHVTIDAYASYDGSVQVFGLYVSVPLSRDEIEAVTSQLGANVVITPSGSTDQDIWWAIMKKTIRKAQCLAPGRPVDLRVCL